jgi:hypothetical protein
MRLRTDGVMGDAQPALHEAAFRPTARLVSILREHLISDQAVGFIERVKNANDADATEVEIEILHVGDPTSTTIAIFDNGCGVSLNDVRTKWLNPAVNHRARAPCESQDRPVDAQAGDVWC